MTNIGGGFMEVILAKAVKPELDLNAAGATEAADLNDIKLIRNFKQINIDVETIIQEGSTMSDIELQSGDQVFVPRTWWADNAVWVTIAISAAALIATTYAIFFRP